VLLFFCFFFFFNFLWICFYYKTSSLFFEVLQSFKGLLLRTFNICLFCFLSFTVIQFSVRKLHHKTTISGLFRFGALWLASLPLHSSDSMQRDELDAVGLAPSSFRSAKWLKRTGGIYWEIQPFRIILLVVREINRKLGEIDTLTPFHPAMPFGNRQIYFRGSF